MLLHLVDGTTGDPAADYRTIITELEAYGGDLADRPRITVMTKIDALDAEERTFIADELADAVGAPVMGMSAVTGEGVQDVLRALRTRIDDDRLRHRVPDADEAPPEDAPWQP